MSQLCRSIGRRSLKKKGRVETPANVEECGCHAAFDHCHQDRVRRWRSFPETFECLGDFPILGERATGLTSTLGPSEFQRLLMSACESTGQRLNSVNMSCLTHSFPTVSVPKSLLRVASAFGFHIRQLRAIPRLAAKPAATSKIQSGRSAGPLAMRRMPTAGTEPLRCELQPLPWPS
jgi:hypothetical protein